MNDPTPLRAWLDQAWNRHADEPQALARELADRAATLPDDADGAEALRLAEHVLLAHLADAPALQALLQAAPATPALQASRQRAAWALAAIAGEPEPALPDGLRWRALHSVVTVDVARGRFDAARARLLADEAAAAAHAETGARVGYAATANNVALDLRLGPRGDAARDALMLEAARLSRRAWAHAGDWMNVERADYQLAMCHAVLGQGAEAVACAEACLARCEAEGAEASELFFALECNVHAQRAAGNPALAAVQRERMAALLPQIGDAGMQQWCSQTLAQTPSG